MALLYGTEVEDPPSVPPFLALESEDVCPGVHFTHSYFGFILCHCRAGASCSHWALRRGEGSEAVVAQGQDSGCLL